MSRNQSSVELLSPAGSREAFEGAVAAGADAVYLGGPAFGARAYAENFTEEELEAAIHEAHLFGVRIYMTTNILTREDELPRLLDLVERMDAAGLDGVIVQDLGVAAALRERCPQLLLHASTQMSVSSAESVRFLKRLGISRVVPARELSLQEMRQILAEEEIEIEAFIHGAMCYSYSGRCLMSSFLGGRSGNRGRCAGTCRLPYTVLDPKGRPASADGECYPLSMKDLCVLEILPDLIDAGICSFKIEGRMKRPEYAAGTTAIYRKYIDRYYTWTAAGRTTPWSIDPVDRQNLLSLYIRSDLSTGYYYQRNGRDMLTMGKGGYTGASDALLQEIHDAYLAHRPQQAIDGIATLMPGRNATLEISMISPVTNEVMSVTAEGPVVESAKARPMTTEDLRRRLCKTGETSFVFRNLAVRTDGNAFLPIGQLNELRRRALQLLEDGILTEYQEQREQITQGSTTSGAPAALLTHAKCAASNASQTLQGRAALQEPSQPQGIASESAPRGLPLDHSLWALVTTWEQYRAAYRCVVAGEIRVIIIDGSLTAEFYRNGWEERFRLQDVYLSDGHLLAAMPYIMRASDRKDLTRLYENCYNKITGFWIRSLEQIEFLHEKDYDSTVVADASLYHWNRRAQEILLDVVTAATLPLELSGRDLYHTYQSSLAREILPVYGRVPMMVSANCVRKTSGCCRHTEDGYYGLLDRKNAVFPVRTDCRHCQNIIYNSVPVSLHRYSGDALFVHVAARLCMFTTENEEQTESILHGFYLLEQQPASDEAVSMIMRALPSGHTSGHYVKGAL